MSVSIHRTRRPSVHSPVHRHHAWARVASAMPAFALFTGSRNLRTQALQVEQIGTGPRKRVRKSIPKHLQHKLHESASHSPSHSLEVFPHSRLLQRRHVSSGHEGLSVFGVFTEGTQSTWQRSLYCFHTTGMCCLLSIFS